MSKGRLIVQAMNINQGGGVNLLLPMLKSPLARGALFFLDCRVKSKLESFDCLAEIVWVRPTITDRLKASWQLAAIAKHSDVALFFGNLPSLFRMRCPSYVYLQNRLLIDGQSLSTFSFKTRIRLHIERLLLAIFKNNANGFLVQTPTMEHILRKRFALHSLDIAVYPYRAESLMTSCINDQINRSLDFIYPASGDAHKNHAVLLAAWKILWEQGIYPYLVLTLPADRFEQLVIETGTHALVADGRIINMGFLDKSDLNDLYKKSKALIFPSLIESFGLPLLEAKEFGLDILAGELDYVRDIVDPQEVFDATSPVSISRAVKRYLSIADGKTPLHDVDGFLNYISSKSSVN